MRSNNGSAIIFYLLVAIALLAVGGSFIYALCIMQLLHCCYGECCVCQLKLISAGTTPYFMQLRNQIVIFKNQARVFSTTLLRWLAGWPQILLHCVFDAAASAAEGSTANHGSTALHASPEAATGARRLLSKFQRQASF